MNEKFTVRMGFSHDFMEPPPLIPKMTTQKLVTIYLDNSAYAKGKMLVGSFGDKHGLVEEHLSAQLADGWRVISICGFGGNSELSVRGWLAVLLEHSTA